MGAGITVEVRDELNGALGAVSRMNAATLAKVAGEDLAIEVQDHLRRLDAERPNAMGGKRTHFYAEAAALTTWTTEGDAVRVSIAGPAGIAQRFFGGTITPQNKEWLTIPARTEAYGKTAREFDNLRFVMFGSGSAALVKSLQTAKTETESVDEAGNVTTRRRKVRPRDEGVVMFWLVKSVTQAADASVLPSKERLAEVAIGSIRDFLGAVAGAGPQGGAV